MRRRPPRSAQSYALFPYTAFFLADGPAGWSSLSMQYQYLTPTDRGQGRVVMTPKMLNLQWNAVVLYPAGHYARRIEYAAAVKYPAGFQAARALDVASRTAATVHYPPVPLYILVDSPGDAGSYFKTFDLAPGAAVPVRR